MEAKIYNTSKSMYCKSAMCIYDCTASGGKNLIMGHMEHLLVR